MQTPFFLEPGDTLLLASDGVTDVLEADAIGGCLGRHDCQEVADTLVSEALKAGATDNVTAVVLRLTGGTALPGKRLPWLPVLLGVLLVAISSVAAATFLLRPGVGAGATTAATGGVLNESWNRGSEDSDTSFAHASRSGRQPQPAGGGSSRNGSASSGDTRCFGDCCIECRLRYDRADACPH